MDFLEKNSSLSAGLGLALTDWPRHKCRVSLLGNSEFTGEARAREGS